MGEKIDPIHAAKEEVGGALGQRKAQLEISAISDQGMPKPNVANSRQMKEL